MSNSFTLFILFTLFASSIDRVNKESLRSFIHDTSVYLRKTELRPCCRGGDAVHRAIWEFVGDCWCFSVNDKGQYYRPLKFFSFFIYVAEFGISPPHDWYARFLTASEHSL